MAKADLGKKFEAVFRENWAQSFPGYLTYRLQDQMDGYRDTSGNPCDFICQAPGKLFFMECKEHLGASIPFTAIPQYERLLQYKNCKDLYPGVTVWFSEKDLVIWVSIWEMEKMVQNGEKSIGIRMLKDKSYNIIVIPSEKLRKFMRSDYTILTKIDEHGVLKDESR